MGHDATNPSCIELMMKQCKAHGFSPFHVKTSSMGYIYNRCVLYTRLKDLITPIIVL